jgi:uncharacterized RDD family membrane protein YckC
VAIAPIGRTGFNIPGASAGVALLFLAVLIYWRSFIALVVATVAMLIVTIYAFVVSLIGALLFLPFLVACVQALAPTWEQRLERRKSVSRSVAVSTSTARAGFWWRLLAGLIDLVVFAVAWYVAAILITIGSAVTGGFDVTNPNSANYEALAGPTYIAGLVLNVFYFVGSWTLLGRTLGMMATRLRLMTGSQHRISVWAAGLRYIALIPSALLIVGLLWIIWDRNKQGWHDKAARSYVIRTIAHGGDANSSKVESVIQGST